MTVDRPPDTANGLSVNSPPALGVGSPATLDNPAADVSKVGELGPQDIGTTVGLPETAKRLGVSTKTAYRYLRQGRLPGSRKIDTPQGEAWQVPVAAIEQMRTKTQGKAKQVPPTMGEVTALVQRVSDLERQLQSVSAIAGERQQTIETITSTMRALSVSSESQSAALTQTQNTLANVQGELAKVSKELTDERARKWWQRRTK